MPCIREGLIRRFIFKVRLSGPFECVFGLNFRLIIGIPEWRDVLQIANMLLLRNPRGTCGCGFKNDWPHIRRHVGFFGGELGPPPSLVFSVVGKENTCFLVLVAGKKTRKKIKIKKKVKIWSHLETRKRLIFCCHRNLASIRRPPLGVSEARF